MTSTVESYVVVGIVNGSAQLVNNSIGLCVQRHPEIGLEGSCFSPVCTRLIASFFILRVVIRQANPARVNGVTSFSHPRQTLIIPLCLTRYVPRVSSSP